MRLLTALLALVVALLVVGVILARQAYQDAHEPACGEPLAGDAAGIVGTIACVRERGHRGDHAWTDGAGNGAVWGWHGAGLHGHRIRRVGP